MHKLLVRQLRRHFGSVDSVPPSLASFVAAIDDAYRQSDADRAFLERTMDLTSGELMERQSQLQDALTKSQEAERQLAHQALHDGLTGLPNRVLFLDRVQHALDRSPRKNTSVAVLFIDLDDFKGVNDTLGHSVGDELLRATAVRLHPMIRSSDTCARLGGDEFAIVLEDTRSTDHAKVVADRVLSTLSAAFVLGTQEVFVGASVGIALAGENESAAELMRNADVAMYIAKTGGKSRAVTYEPSMHTAVARRVALEQELRSAIDRREFMLNFQPIVSLETGHVAGLEALARWHHPSRGLIPALEFIPAAERSGLILELGQWILGEACRACVTWEVASSSNHGISVTVNVSGRELLETEYVDLVKEALDQSGLSPQRLVLEVTENVLVGNDTATVERLRALRALGVLIAIDDFGTGYSSLSYLQEFPVDILKIDKSFVDNLGSTGKDSPLSRAVVSLGAALGVQTIAEGIETDEQRRRLSAMGCPYGQGFLFSRPLPAGEVASFLVKSRGSAATPRLGAVPPGSNGDARRLATTSAA